MAPEFEPHEIPATDLASHAVESIKELRKERLKQWCIRSAITGTLLWWLSTKYTWARTVLVIWAVFALLSLVVLVFLPSIVGNRIRAMEQKMKEGIDLGGMAGMPGMSGMPGMGEGAAGPRDVEVDDVRDVDADVLELPAGGAVPDVVPVPLEDQLTELATFGITLSSEVSLDDLTHSIAREELEAHPYGPLVHLLGVEVEREPWGRFFSDRLWNFDAECIEGDGSYVDIVDRLAAIAGKADSLKDATDSVDVDGGKATLSYSVDGTPRKFRPKVTDDWADPATVQSILGDFTDLDQGFYGIMAGQTTTIMALRREDADRFRALISEELEELA
jgi:membrane protein YdbS with pleckstrin-like domain